MSAFLALLVFALVRQEMFEGTEKVGTETAAFGIGLVEPALAQHAREKALREFTGGILVAAFATKEPKARAGNRSRRSRLARLARRSFGHVRAARGSNACD